MRNNDRHLRLLADVERFADRLRHLVGLIAHVGDVNRILELAQYRCDLQYFGGWRGLSRRIVEAGAQPYAALLQGES